MTEEHKRKLSEAQKGRTFTLEHRLKLSAAHRGKVPWNKGIPHTEATKLKLSRINIGRPSPRKGIKGGTPWNKGRSWTPEEREKLSQAHIGKMTGPNHPNWRGGTKRERLRIMATALYQKWRKAVLARDDFRCFACGERSRRLNAHHLYPWKYFPRLRFALENGITLCEECHRTIPYSLKAPDNIVAPAGMIFNPSHG
jgi:hypothetical protein